MLQKWLLQAKKLTRSKLDVGCEVRRGSSSRLFVKRTGVWKKLRYLCCYLRVKYVCANCRQKYKSCVMNLCIALTVATLLSDQGQDLSRSLQVSEN